MLAYNPASGSFCSQALGRVQQALMAQGHAVRAENSRVFRFSEEDPVDLICAYGGDGTARTVVAVNGEAASGAPYCAYPSGTINLLARERAYPADPARFARIVGQRFAEPRAGVAFGRINGEPFLCCASVGPDAEAVARVSPRLKKRIGRLAYAVAVLSMLIDWPRRSFRVALDGQTLVGEAVFVLKGRYYAGPFVLDGGAGLAQGQFRVVILPRAGRRDLARLALSALFPALASPAWHRLSASAIRITGPEDAPVQADGDVLAHTPATLTIAPFSLNFL